MSPLPDQIARRALLALPLLATAAQAQGALPAGRSSFDARIRLEADGEEARLRFLVQRPEAAGPYPLVVFHHGSTGRGNNPALFAQPFFPEAFAAAFAASGWLVVAPQRRGRGGSGSSYAEGLGANGYDHEPSVALAGYERAMRDARAATAFLLARPEVDASRVLLAGQSRGGILALGQAARAPAAGVRGVLNFVGGWLGTRWEMSERVNRELFTAAGRSRVPSLHLYGERDPFYPLTHSRANFEAYVAAGGRGRFVAFETPEGQNGHGLLFRPAQWSPTVVAFRRELGLEAVTN